MRKKFTSALLTACLVLGLALPARAASQPQQEEAIQVVNALGIMVGDTNGNMNLSSRVTRAEFITMAAVSYTHLIAVKADRIIRLQDGKVIYDGDAHDPRAVVQPGAEDEEVEAV